MSDIVVAIDHIHIISEDPASAAQWYADMLDGSILGESEVRGAPQIAVAFGDIRLLIRSKRKGEAPSHPRGLQHYADYISHNTWGTDHFGFKVLGDLDQFCEDLRNKGAAFHQDPHDFAPGVRIAFLKAPDGVTIELVQAG